MEMMLAVIVDVGSPYYSGCRRDSYSRREFTCLESFHDIQHQLPRFADVL